MVARHIPVDDFLVVADRLARRDKGLAEAKGAVDFVCIQLVVVNMERPHAKLCFDLGPRDIRRCVAVVARLDWLVMFQRSPAYQLRAHGAVLVGACAGAAAAVSFFA